MVAETKTNLTFSIPTPNRIQKRYFRRASVLANIRMNATTTEKRRKLVDPILVAMAAKEDADRALSNSCESESIEVTKYNLLNRMYVSCIQSLASASDVAAAEAKVAAAKDDVAAAESKVAIAVSNSESIITNFKQWPPKEVRLTYAPPYGMLGRDKTFDDIINEMNNPSDKLPPITVISTSRAGKTLLLDTLVRRCNSDPNSGVYVVTCSLNGTRASYSNFEVGHCTSSDVPLFVAFVLNALLFGSIGHHDYPKSAAADSLAWPAVLSPDTLCALIRKRFGLDESETTKGKKLLLAVDELTSFFDRFDSDSRKEIASSLGVLCTTTSRLLLTGFTTMADDAFLGVSKRLPVRFQLPSIDSSTRHNLIPQMTAMLWGVRYAMRDPRDTSEGLRKYFPFVYCVLHETIKSSPGLIGTVVERLIRNSIILELYYDFTMWGVLRTVMKLLPDYIVYDDAETRAGAFSALDAFLRAQNQDVELPALMLVNMAAPGRLDAFRVIMAMQAERAARGIYSPAAMEFSDPKLPPTVQVLSRDRILTSEPLPATEY